MKHCVGSSSTFQKVSGYLGPYRFLRTLAKPPGHPAVLEFFKGRIDNVLGILDKRLAGVAYVVGSEPTIADLSLVGYLYYPPEVIGFDVAANYKNIAAWSAASRRCPVATHAYELTPGIRCRNDLCCVAQGVSRVRDRKVAPLGGIQLPRDRYSGISSSFGRDAAASGGLAPAGVAWARAGAAAFGGSTLASGRGCGCATTFCSGAGCGDGRGGGCGCGSVRPHTFPQRANIGEELVAVDRRSFRSASPTPRSPARWLCASAKLPWAGAP